MSKPPFTPGPWHTFASGRAALRNSVEVNNPVGLTVAYAVTFVPEYATEGEANARLIAAAPDLHEALDWLLASVTADPASEVYPGDKEERITLACGAARTALAKANGQ